MIATFSLVALDCPDPRALARFYRGITGWEIDHDGGSWVQLRSEAGATIAFQQADDHQPPVWPSADRPQQLHLDFDVDDLDVGEREVLALGARKAQTQPGSSFRVFLDPAGHPFCLVQGPSRSDDASVVDTIVPRGRSGDDADRHPPASGDLRGARFEKARMTDARFRLVDLGRAHFDQVTLRGVVMRGVELADVEIDGEVNDLRINGVDVAPLIEAELDRRDPARAKMRPSDADGFREAWTILEDLWDRTLGRARGMDPALLHASVDGEWSFIETLRHLVFATDAWVRCAVLGDPDPWHPLDLPHDTFEGLPGIPLDRQARPPLDEVIALRADRQATVRRILDDLTDDRLDDAAEPPDGAAYPPPGSYTVRACLTCILAEEWQHRLYAERDLDALVARR